MAVEKKYTRKEAEKVMERVTILMGLTADNVPQDKDLFFEYFIDKVLNKYGEDRIYKAIEMAANKTYSFDLKLYGKPINIVWFIDLLTTCNNRPGFQQ